jgi:hypothetical protein
VQPAKLLDHVQARPHPQVKGVAQNDLCAHFFQAARHHAFDGAVGAHRHENRGFNHAMVEGHTTATRKSVGGVGFEEFEFQHGVDCRKHAATFLRFAVLNHKKTAI